MKNNNSFSPTMLIILDGFGHSDVQKGNAIAATNMPNWRRWQTLYPHTLLKASGEAVGLLPGYMGNSEVGHLAIGAGRIIKSILVRMHEKIEDGSFFKNKQLIGNFKKCEQGDHALHLMGLLSDAGVHSHQQHLYALIKLAHECGVKKTFIHAFLDGRDTPPQSAATYLEKLDSYLQQYPNTKLASLHGRFYAMDRDENWNRTKQCYKILTTPSTTSISWEIALEQAYKKGETDEFITPIMLEPNSTIKPSDGIVFFNFRSDRARQLTEMFLKGSLSFFISTIRYKEEFNNTVLFEKDMIEHTILDECTAANKTVFITAETEKYAHVTYFFKGKRDEKASNETRKLIPSIKSKNYIDHPEMSAPQITQTILESLHNDPKDFYLVNYANADMVGHSGDFDATVKACECLDEQLEKLYQEVVKKQNGTIFITGDHGNAESMLDNKGRASTFHTSNPVPFMAINKTIKTLKEAFGLRDIAPIILRHLNIAVPEEMNRK